MSYSEEMVHAVERLADAFAQQENGYCTVLFNEYESKADYAIVKFSPSFWGGYQKNPVQFFALLRKEYDKPASIEILDAKDDASAIRLGISRIDRILVEANKSAEAQEEVCDSDDLHF